MNIISLTEKGQFNYSNKFVIHIRNTKKEDVYTTIRETAADFLNNADLELGLTITIFVMSGLLLITLFGYRKFESPAGGLEWHVVVSHGQKPAIVQALLTKSSEKRKSLRLCRLFHLFHPKIRNMP
ncbi:hypothetical protein BC351_04560 [Paenibacillus ferrarius]|uniref:Uncharacterized protein n=1 Tax=Paenibacillus ferrarius TaxID=1469647 RepID=A0A1V4HKK6_9BACL|nr:hypothetical protein [Paenibacillus ferrarius]OPH57782.1 hypothetical protein BC351_04560 [Paenibacillus ferrarius]